MGYSVFPAPSAGGGIKSVQRGSAAGAGNVTITAVNTAKTFVNVFGTASSGVVSASFNMSMNAGSVDLVGVTRGPLVYSNYTSMKMPPGASQSAPSTTSNSPYNKQAWIKTQAVNSGTASVGAGSNNLVSAVVQGFIADSTTLTVSGACRWEVVEFA